LGSILKSMNLSFGYLKVGIAVNAIFGSNLNFHETIVAIL
jgi:hypothetical protein